MSSDFINESQATLFQGAIAAKMQDDHNSAEPMARAIASRNPNSHSPVATAISKMVTLPDGSIDKGISTYLGKLFTAIADKVDTQVQRDESSSAQDEKMARMMSIAAKVKLPAEDLVKSVTVWQEGDPEPLEARDSNRAEDYFTLKITDDSGNESKHAIEVIRSYNSGVTSVDGDGNRDFSQDAMKIIGIKSVGEFGQLDFAQHRAAQEICDAVFDAVTELDKKMNQ